jgi:hypothetical protein
VCRQEGDKGDKLAKPATSILMDEVCQKERRMRGDTMDEHASTNSVDE